MEGDIGEARKLFNEALTIALRIANLSNARVTLHGSPPSPPRAATRNTAARLAAAAKPDVHGHQLLGPAATDVFERNLAAARAQSEVAEWEAAWSAGAS